MSPDPSVAPSPPPPYSAAGPPPVASPSSYALSLACADIMLLLIAVGYSYCLRWCSGRVNQAHSDHDIERPQQQVEAAALPVVVVAYRRDAREFNSDECTICLANFEEGEECWVIKTCNHGYHEGCIKKWLSRDLHCPLCRGSVQAGRATSVAPAPTSS